MLVECAMCGCVISIHAAREGGDYKLMVKAQAHFKFQSTPPVKAATFIGIFCAAMLGISIHAAREGGDVHAVDVRKGFIISIHAAREGGDNSGNASITRSNNFNPRRP